MLGLASVFTVATQPRQLMNSPRLLTVVLAAGILLALTSLVVAQEEKVAAVNNNGDLPPGKYQLTAIAFNAAISPWSMPLLDPVLVQIGGRTFVTGTVCDVSSAARRSEFVGQKAYVAFDAILSMQRYPDEE